jgi:hypothetical protein
MMRRLFSVFALTLTLCFGSGAAGAAGTVPSDALVKLFAQSSVDASLFAGSFPIPISDVDTFVKSYVARIGAPTTVAADGASYDLTSPKGSIKADIALDPQGKISSLLFHDELSQDNYAALLRVLSADTIVPDWFEPSYLHDVPTQKLVSLLADMHAKLGKLVRIETRKGKYFAVFEHGESHAQISADIDDRIDYLAFSKT